MAEDVHKVLNVWSPTARRLAESAMRNYGPPHFVMGDLLAWNYGGSWWKRMAVRRSGMIEQVVYYIVPEAKLIEVVDLEANLGAPAQLRVDVAESEVGVVSQSELMNLLLLNIMHDVARGALKLSEAEKRYRRALERMRFRWPEPYAEQLHFHTDVNHIQV